MHVIILLLSSILGSVLTYYFSLRFKQSAVRSSALLSLIVGLFFYGFPDLLPAYLTRNIPVVFFGSSFIGMVSSEAKVGYFRLGIAGVLFCGLYIYKSPLFDGYGGGLGALAFISLLATMGFSEVVFKHSKIKDILLDLRKRYLMDNDDR